MQVTGGFLKSRKIDSPKGSNVRPTLSQVRESIFSTLFSLTDFDEKSFLDVFAGSGIMGFEAVSRGFSNACFIEKDKKTYFLLKTNAEKLGLTNEQAVFFCGDSLKILSKLSQKFDVVYVDPPYLAGLYDNVIKTIKEKDILNENGVLILEHPKDLQINIAGFELIKQKIYADKAITFIR